MSSLLPGNFVYGGASTVTECQNYKSLGHLILEKFKSLDKQIFLIDGVSGAEYSGKYMHDSISHLANVLQKFGIKRGDVVGISSENRIEFAITLFATLAVNATVAPFSITYSERELQHAINLSKPKIFFSSKQTMQKVAKVAAANDFIKSLVVYGSANESPSAKIYAFDDLMQEKIIGEVTFQPQSANKQEDVAVILCSSGTTGQPKGVQLTQKNILAGLDSQLEPPSKPMSGVKILDVIPWFHTFGCMTLIRMVIWGCTMVFMPKFEAKLFLSAIEKYRVAMLLMVPPLMVFLAKQPIVDNYDLSSLMVIWCSAAPLSKETQELIKKRINVPVIRQAYGLSESTMGLLLQNDTACKPGSVGALKKGLYAKVIDPETGKLLGANQRGELCFKGDIIMKGYIGDVESTETTIKDNWLHTGDIGYFDDDFEFFIVDRIKELIKYKGYQVPPAEIEALLLTHPKIKDAAVIGKPDEEAGELPMAFVVKQANVQLTADDVQTFVAARASPAKKLRGGVLFVDEIPKNPSGKILRRVLRDTIKSKTNSKL